MYGAHRQAQGMQEGMSLSAWGKHGWSTDRDGACSQGCGEQEQCILARVGHSGKQMAGRHSQAGRHSVCSSRDGPPPTVVHWTVFNDVPGY